MLNILLDYSIQIDKRFRICRLLAHIVDCYFFGSVYREIFVHFEQQFGPVHTIDNLVALNDIDTLLRLTADLEEGWSRNLDGGRAAQLLRCFEFVHIQLNFKK